MTSTYICRKCGTIDQVNDHLESYQSESFASSSSSNSNSHSTNFIFSPIRQQPHSNISPPFKMHHTSLDTSTSSSIASSVTATAQPTPQSTPLQNNTPLRIASPVERVKRVEYERQRANSEDATSCFMTPISVPLSSNSSALASFHRSIQNSRNGVSSTLIENVMRHLRLLNERRSELSELDLLRELTMLLTGHRYSSPASRLSDDNNLQCKMDDSCLQLDQDVRNWLETEMNPLQLSSRSADNSDILPDSDDHTTVDIVRQRRMSQSGRSISASTPRSASRTLNPSRLLSGRRINSKRSIVPIITAPSMLSSGQASSQLPMSQTAPILYLHSPTSPTRCGSASFHDSSAYESNSTSNFNSITQVRPSSPISLQGLTFQFNSSPPTDEPPSLIMSPAASPPVNYVFSDAEMNVPTIDLRPCCTSPCRNSCECIVGPIVSPTSKSQESISTSHPSHSPNTPSSPIFVMRVTSHEGVEAAASIKPQLSPCPPASVELQSSAAAASIATNSTNSISSPTYSAFLSQSPVPNLSIAVSSDLPISLLPDMSAVPIAALDTLALRKPQYSEVLNKLDYWFEVLNEDKSPKSAPCLYDDDGEDEDDTSLIIPMAETIPPLAAFSLKDSHVLPFQASSQFSVSFKIPEPITDPMDAALHISWNSLNDWQHFDIFHLADATHRWPLSFMFLMVCQKHGLFAALHINPAIAFRFIQEVEAGYLNNPYHTSTHAADVLHALYLQITETFLFTKLTYIEKFALFIAAAIHDFGHPGVNNAFLINQSHPLALTYNDRSVLESYHIAQVFHMMDRIPHANILCDLSRADQKKIRKIIIDCVMATDLAYHFDLLAQMKSKTQLSLDYDYEGDRSLLMQMCLKCADISHPSRSRYLHLQWAELLTEEFFLQGDREKRAGMPPSMFMDRSNAALGRSQIGFISVFVLPLYREMGSFLQRDIWTRRVEDNLLVWQEVHKEEEREKEKEHNLSEAFSAASNSPSINSISRPVIDPYSKISTPHSNSAPPTISSPKLSAQPDTPLISVVRRSSIASPKTLQAFSFPYLPAVNSTHSSGKAVSSPHSRMSLQAGNFIYTHRSSVSSSPGRSSRRTRAAQNRRSISADGRRRAHSLWTSFASIPNAATTCSQIPVQPEDIISPAPNSLSPNVLSVPTPNRYLSLRTRDMFHRVRQISESTCSSYTSSPAVSPLSTSPLPSPLGCSPYKEGLRVISWR